MSPGGLADQLSGYRACFLCKIKVDLVYYIYILHFCFERSHDDDENRINPPWTKRMES